MCVCVCVCFWEIEWEISGLNFESLGLQYVPQVVTFKNSTFCPQNCMYVLCIYLRKNSDCHRIQNWVLFVTETEYSVVQSGGLNRADYILSLKG